MTQWEEFCRLHEVPKIYKDCSLGMLDIPSNQDGIDFTKSGFSFMKEPVSLILQGDPGRGKTFFMYSLIHALLEVRKMHISSVRFMNAEDLDQRVTDEIAKFKTASYFLSTLADANILFIDDFGVENSKEKAERNYYAILNKRLANEKTTVLSTNLTDDEILSIFGSRIDSRLKQCVKLVFDGPDLRKPKGFK